MPGLYTAQKFSVILCATLRQTAVAYLIMSWVDRRELPVGKIAKKTAPKKQSEGVRFC